MTHKERGATFIELILAMGLLAVLLAMAGEGFVAAASRYQGKTVATELAGELRVTFPL